MDNNNKLFKIILMVLLGSSALLSILFMVDVIMEGVLIAWCYLLLGIAGVVALGFSLLGMIKNPKGAKNALIGIVALIIIVGIGYALGTGEEHLTVNGDILADEASSKKSEAGIIATFILLFLAIGTWVYAEVSKMFK